MSATEARPTGEYPPLVTDVVRATCPSCEGTGIMRLTYGTALHRKGARFKCGACLGTGGADHG